MMQLDIANPVEQFLCDKAVEGQVPISGTFELLPLCNMNCRMCYIHLNSSEMKKQGKIKNGEEWIKIARQAANMGTLFVLLTGGEPLLHPEFRDIYRKLLELGMYVTINTNGTLIDENLADFFAENVPRRINVTLYGSSRKIYQQVCSDADAFDRAIYGIKLLKEREIPLKLNATISRYNIKDVGKIMDLADSMELPIEIPYYLFPQSRKSVESRSDDYRLSPKEAAGLRMEITKHGFQGREDALYQDIRNTLFQIDHHNTANLPEKPEGFWCRSGRSAFWVSWNGRMTSCGLLETPCADLNEMDFCDAWNILQSKVQKVQLPDKCYECKYRDICGIVRHRYIRKQVVLETFRNIGVN